MGLRVELGEGDMDCELEFITLSREFVLSGDVFGVADSVTDGLRTSESE